MYDDLYYFLFSLQKPNRFSRKKSYCIVSSEDPERPVIARQRDHLDPENHGGSAVDVCIKHLNLSIPLT